MPIRLTEEQWDEVQKEPDLPVRVNDPTEGAAFVLMRAEVYERFKALFENDPATEQERQYLLEQFGRRAGWDDPEMDVYDELDPRRKS